MQAGLGTLLDLHDELHELYQTSKRTENGHYSGLKTACACSLHLQMWGKDNLAHLVHGFLKWTADGLFMKPPDEVVGQEQAPSGGRPPTALNPGAEVLGRTEGVKSALYSDFISPHGVSLQTDSKKYSL